MQPTSVRQLAIALVPAGFVLAVVAVVRLWFGVTTSAMTQDIASLAGIHPLSGFLSNLGILLWGAAASVSLFGAAILRTTGPRDAFRFLLASGALSALLLIDDLFMIHDDLVIRYLDLPQISVLALLGVAAGAYFIGYGRFMLRRTAYGMLLLAMGLFAISVLFDQLVNDPGAYWYGSNFVEDSAKWLGIACWCSYHWRSAHDLVVSTVSCTLLGDGATLAPTNE